jgi:hypothetical protein
MSGRNPSIAILLLLLISVSTSILFSTTSIITHENGNGILHHANRNPVISSESRPKIDSLILLPEFYENQGQFGIEDVLYYSPIPGGFIGFSNDKVSIWISEGNENIILSYVDANDVTPIGVSETDHKSNFFIGNRGTFTNVRSYTSIRYLDLWEGIDLVFKSTPEGVKYEFELSPFSSPLDIKIRCEGHEELVVKESTIKTFVDDECILDDGLKVLQNEKVIEACFNAIDDNTYGFDIGQYDINQPLVIDPLLYSTYIGGSGDDEAHSLSIDDEGNVYVVGETTSLNFPVEDPYNNESSGGYDCFVMKMNATGNGLLYSTYVGGVSDDFAYSLYVDSSGCSFVTGVTISSDFPTVNALDDSYYDNDEAYVFKLNATGNGIVYSTFYGGWSDDIGEGIAVDPQGNAHVVLMTGSWDLPAINAYDPTEDDGWDTYVFKLNATGNGLLYATYVAGNAADQPYDLTLDSEGNVYVCGRTGGGTFPTVNAYDSTPNGDWDVFVYKLNSTGNGLIFSTFVGGNHMDWAAGIAIDSQKNVYVTGTAWSVNFPRINTIYTPDPEAPFDTMMYVFKLSSSGSSLIYSSLIGHGSAVYDCEGTPIEVDAYGNAYVATTTSSGYFPVVNPLMSRPGSYDGIILQLNATGNGLIYSTWIGGSASDYCRAIAIDSIGTAYVAGKTYSDNFFTESPYDGSLSGSTDAFLAKLTDIGDLTGPDVQLSHNPENPVTTDDVTITASISDQHGVVSATLEYSINLGVSWNNISMTKTGSVWTGIIQSQPVDTEVWYRVYAQDDRSNWAISPTKTYSVGEAPTSTTTTSSQANQGLDPFLIASIVGVVVLIIVIIAVKRKQS